MHLRNFLIPALLLCSQLLSGQSIEQRQRSATVFSEFLPLPKGLELTAEDISQLKPSDLKTLLQQDERFSPKTADELIQQMVPNDMLNWRAVVADFSRHCQENVYIAVISNEDPTETIMYIYFPPGNKCESLYLALVEAGIVQPFFDPSTIYTSYQACIRKHCVAGPRQSCCFNIIQQWPLGKDCPPDACAEISYCDCTKELSWDDLYMEN